MLRTLKVISSMVTEEDGRRERVWRCEGVRR